MLEAALNGKGTGWCTATGSAASQLNDGDFYVFFSHNQDGEATEPRVAIRMEGGSVAEIRGIDKNQEMEPEMLGVAQEFYQDLPGAESYVAKEANTQRLTEITQRVGESSPQHYPYTAEELRFLYEVDGPIETFGYARDPRIDRLLAGRDFRQDLAQVLECAPEQISITKEEALAGGIAFHYGNSNPSAEVRLDKSRPLPIESGNFSPRTEVRLDKLR